MTMSSLMRLAAVLAAFLPVSGLIWSPLVGRASRLHRESRRRLSVPELQAYVNEGAAQLREALVTSDAFEDLVKRLEEKAQDGGASNGHLDDVFDGPSAADVVAHKTPATPDTHISHAAPATTAAGGDATSSCSSGESEPPLNAWKKNSEKLAALRTTVLESPKARGMRESFVNGSSVGVHDSAEVAHATAASASSDSPSVAAAPDAAASDPPAVAAVAAEEQGPASSSFTAEATTTAAPADPTEPIGDGEGEQVGRRARRFRWVRRLASKVSNVGRRARGRPVRILAKDGATEEGPGL